MSLIKKVLLLFGAAAAVVIGIRMQEARNASVNDPSSPPVATPPLPAPTSPPAYGPAPTPTNSDSTMQKVARMATLDPLKKRQLDKPLPKGKRDLLNNLTDFKAPLLPGLTTEDSDVKAVFRGFYEAEPGKFRRLELTRAQMVSVSIEDVNQRFPTYQESKGDFDLSCYADDPYSLVLTLRDMRVLYLKFHTGKKIPDYTDPNFRVMTGWLIEGRGARTARQVALIDGRKPELADTRASGQYVWPRLEVIRMLMPGSELPD